MTNTEIIIIVGTLVAIPLLGYLAACAGAQKWINIREWWK